MKINSGLSILLSFLFLISIHVQAAAPLLKVNTFGNPANPAIIFVHGGPAYNSYDFEVKTAPDLAQKGYYVITYDQRGQGRSADAVDPLDYTYNQYSQDLMDLISNLHLHDITLIGHSHGGPISLHFAKYYPGIVEKIILASAPVNFWSSIQSIVLNCNARFQIQNDNAAIVKLNSEFAPLLAINSVIDLQIKAVADVFSTAGRCGLYKTSQSTPAAVELKKEIASNLPVVSQNNKFFPMPGFLINENYIRQDYTLLVQNNSSRIFGIYGEDDGLFTPKVLQDIQSALASNPSPYRFQIIKGSSHAMYVDQNDEFIQAVLRVLK